MKHPVCLTGKGAGPPEDVGGVWGYAEFLEAINDPGHEEHESYLEWIGGELDPKAFDLEATNTALKRMIAAVLLSACGSGTPKAIETLPAPRVSTALPPNPEGTVSAFLNAWQQNDYLGMYALLSPLSQDAISPEEFAARYADAATAMTLSSVEPIILSSLQKELDAEVLFRAVYKTALVGTQMAVDRINKTGGINGRPIELIVAETAGRVIGTVQLTFTPGLSRQGMWRATIEAVRIAAGERNKGIGAAMIHHTIARARARGCGVIQLTSDKSREDAQRFYERLGFTRTHVGMKLSLQ